MGRAKFWAIISQTHRVTLEPTYLNYTLISKKKLGNNIGTEQSEAISFKKT
jgi:hypothetical protein